LIIDFKNKKKKIFTPETAEWFTTSLSDDANLIQPKKVKIIINKSSKKINAIVNLNFKPSLGGKQKYKINFTYNNSTPQQEDLILKNFHTPTAVDILSIFIDNEKLIEMINKKLSQNNYRIPDKFEIIWEQDGKQKLNVKFNLKAKLKMDLSESDLENF